jgi:multidrug resistance efflux pump
LVSQGAQTEFRLQDTQVQSETAQFQLQAAKAEQSRAKIALDSEINGVNTAVAQYQAQLDNAKWELEQTTIRAPADGYVTLIALTVGDRAMQTSPAMSFIVTNEISVIGMFSQNGFDTIKPEAAVELVFDNRPGQIYYSTISAIPRGVGQGQVSVSGTLARVGSVGGANAYPAIILIPDGVEQDQLRLGMSGNATVFAKNAGVIETLMSILVWISSYTAYL